MKIKPDITSTTEVRSPSLDTNSFGKAASDSPLACLQQEFSNFIADIESLARQTMSLPGEDLNGIRERLHQRVKQARASAEASAEIAADSLQRYTRKAIDGTSQYVRDRPWQSVAIGAVIGVAVGLAVVYRKSLTGKL